MSVPQPIKHHLEETMILWHSTITELGRLNEFLSMDKINDQFYRRLFLRCVFSIIETYVHLTKELIKVKITLDNNQSIQLTWEELVILNEKKVFLETNGKVKTKEEFQRFEASLRFTLNTFSKIFELELPNYEDGSFHKLIILSARRNDITHPKSPSKLIIKDNEIGDIVEVLRWFISAHNSINQKYIQWMVNVFETK